MKGIDALSRRSFLSLAGAAVTAGCAGMGGGVSMKTGSGPIAFWSNHPGQSTAVEKELIGRFQNQFPGLSVKLIDAGKDYDEVAQKFNAALIGTDVPDVVVLDDIWWFHFALSGVIAPLDDLFGQAGVDAGGLRRLAAGRLRIRRPALRAALRALDAALLLQQAGMGSGRPAGPRTDLLARVRANGARGCSASSATEDRRTAGPMPNQFPGRSRDRTGHSAAPTPTSGP